MFTLLATAELISRRLEELFGRCWIFGPRVKVNIGHVQMRDVAVGYDTGYRVCAYLSGGGIIGYTGDDKPLIQKWLTAAAATPKTQSVLTELAKTHPFDIRLTDHGEGKLDDAIKVKF